MCLLFEILFFFLSKNCSKHVHAIFQRKMWWSGEAGPGSIFFLTTEPDTISGSNEPTLCSCGRVWDFLIRTGLSSDSPFRIPAFWQCMSHSEITRTSARQKAYPLRNVVRDGKGLGSWWHGWAAYTPSSWFKKQINPCQFKPLSADYIPNWYNWSMWEICLAGENNK